MVALATDADDGADGVVADVVVDAAFDVVATADGIAALDAAALLLGLQHLLMLM